MNKIAAALAWSSWLLACQSSPSASLAPGHNGSGPVAKPSIITVPEVAALVQRKVATVVDANGPDTRHEMGVVPGARLLTNAYGYALSELPPAKSSKLVFYCGGEMCRSSDAAAARAVQAGYTDVNVMRAGIRGWKGAGQPTEIPRS